MTGPLATTAAGVDLDPDQRRTMLDSFGRLLDAHCPRGSRFEEIGCEDGWLDTGAPPAAGGSGLDLYDLALLAVEWGRRLPRLPFSPTLLGRRWQVAGAGPGTGRLSFLLPAQHGVIAPFGTAPVQLDGPLADPVIDEFSWSLPLARGQGSVCLSAERIAELQVLFAAEALGAARENFARAMAYSQERMAFGQPISGFQAMRHLMADLLVHLELATSALFWAITTSGRERQRALRIATRRCRQVCADCVQVFGGIAYTWELGTHRFLRHATVARELAGLPVRHPADSGISGAEGGVDGPGEAAFRDRVRAWLTEAVAGIEALAGGPPDLDPADEIRREWGRVLHRAGYAALAWPREYGGAGANPAQVAIFYEECARAHAPNELNRIGINLAGPAIMHAGSEAQKRRFLPPIIAGEEIWCEGFSEPNAGSDLAAVTTTARWDGTRFLINGAKIWTSYAHLADRCYLLARTSGEAPRHQNLTVFLLDMRQPGVSVQPLRQITGRSDFNQVFFADAVATADEVLGQVNGGWHLATIGAAGVRSVGAATAVWHHYARIRRMIDQLAADADRAGRADQRIDDYRQRLELLWWHIARCAGMVPHAGRFPAPTAATQVVKLHWSQLFQEVAAAGIDNYASDRRDFWRNNYLEARAVKIFGGSCELQRNVIADQYLGLRKSVRK
jgi:alkylation response protein AidB-like acyl-CoA dehydrogenase